MRAALFTLLACACTPKPAPIARPSTPGLHLLAAFEAGDGAAELAARLPGCAANALAMRAELAVADHAAFERARVHKSALIEGIAENLTLDRPVWVFLLPAELRPTNLPELTDGGVILLADEPEDMVVWRVLRGVALTHPRLPAAGTLLADVVRGGVASRFAISEVRPEALAGDSPFVSYPPAVVAERLPHLLAMAVHHPNEPAASYQSGWLQRPDLELLGWLGTRDLGDWSAWQTRGPSSADAITAAVFSTLERLAHVSDERARPSGFFAHDFLLKLDRTGERAESILVTYERGMALLRVHRTNVEGRAARVLGRVDAEPLTRFLVELESLDLSTLRDHHDVTIERDTRWHFSAHSQAGSIAFGFDVPYPTDDERYRRLASAFADLVSSTEGRQ